MNMKLKFILLLKVNLMKKKNVTELLAAGDILLCVFSYNEISCILFSQ